MEVRDWLMLVLNLPNFYNTYPLYSELMNNKEVFDTSITNLTVYGSFPQQIWNGGRMTSGEKVQKAEIENVFRQFNEDLNLPIELTFNNSCLDSKSFDDKYCNYIASVANDYHTTIIISDNRLKDYLSNKYPNLKFKRSCITFDGFPDGWDYYVYSQFMNDRLDIPDEIIPKVELVANADCVEDCNQFHLHHRVISDFNCKGESNVSFACPMCSDKFSIYNSRLRKHFISKDKMLELNKQGYQHFKVLSRHYIGQAINDMCYYLIKPEYKDDVVAMLFIAQNSFE